MRSGRKQGCWVSGHRQAPRHQPPALACFHLFPLPFPLLLVLLLGCLRTYKLKTSSPLVYPIHLSINPPTPPPLTHTSTHPPIYSPYIHPPYLSTHPSTHSFSHPSTHPPSTHLPIHPSTYLSTQPPTPPSTHPPTHPSIYPSSHSFFLPCLYLFFFLPIFQSTHQTLIPCPSFSIHPFITQLPIHDSFL